MVGTTCRSCSQTRQGRDNAARAVASSSSVDHAGMMNPPVVSHAQYAPWGQQGAGSPWGSSSPGYADGDAHGGFNPNVTFPHGHPDDAHDHTDAKPERRLYIAAQQCLSRADAAQHRSSSDTANAWSRPRRVNRCARRRSVFCNARLRPIAGFAASFENGNDQV